MRAHLQENKDACEDPKLAANEDMGQHTLVLHVSKYAIFPQRV